MNWMTPEEHTAAILELRRRCDVIEREFELLLNAFNEHTHGGDMGLGFGFLGPERTGKPDNQLRRKHGRSNV